jgi:hypothetical protein
VYHLGTRPQSDCRLVGDFSFARSCVLPEQLVNGAIEVVSDLFERIDTGRTVLPTTDRRVSELGFLLKFRNADSTLFAKSRNPFKQQKNPSFV